MIEKGIIDKVLCINNSLQSQRPELVSTFSLQKLRELKKSARKVTLYETAKLHKFEHPQNIITEKINFQQIIDQTGKYTYVAAQVI